MWQRLHNIINPALDSVSADLIRKYFRKGGDYERAYIEGEKAGKEVENAGAGIVECPAVYSEGAGNVEGPAAYGAGAGTVEGPGPSENTSNRLFFSSAFIALALAAYTCLLVLASQTSWSLAVVAGRNIQHCRSFNNDTCN